MVVTPPEGKIVDSSGSLLLGMYVCVYVHVCVRVCVTADDYISLNESIFLRVCVCVCVCVTAEDYLNLNESGVGVRDDEFVPILARRLTIQKSVTVEVKRYLDWENR
jgi:hypothetical protein